MIRSKTAIFLKISVSLPDGADFTSQHSWPARSQKADFRKRLDCKRLKANLFLTLIARIRIRTCYQKTQCNAQMLDSDVPARNVCKKLDGQIARRRRNLAYE